MEEFLQISASLHKVSAPFTRPFQLVGFFESASHSFFKLLSFRLEPGV